MAGPTPEQVQEWLDEVEGEISAVHAQLEPLIAEQSRLQERRTILKELLASFADVTSSSESRLAAPAAASETVRERVHRQAVEIFREAGGAVHINDLHAEFVKRGLDVPGAGRPANITVHLSGWEDIVSPERGMYGLREHLGDVVPRKKAKRRKSKGKGRRRA